MIAMIASCTERHGDCNYDDCAYLLHVIHQLGNADVVIPPHPTLPRPIAVEHAGDVDAELHIILPVDVLCDVFASVGIGATNDVSERPMNEVFDRGQHTIIRMFSPPRSRMARMNLIA